MYIKFSSVSILLSALEWLLAEARQDLQSGELTHVREGRVGQRVDLVVAQVSEGKMKQA